MEEKEREEDSSYTNGDNLKLRKTYRQGFQI
jgi:hypothetical protein